MSTEKRTPNTVKSRLFARVYVIYEITLVPLDKFPLGSATFMGGMNIFVCTFGLHFRSTVSTTLLLMFRLKPVDMTSSVSRVYTIYVYCMKRVCVLQGEETVQCTPTSYTLYIRARVLVGRNPLDQHDRVRFGRYDCDRAQQQRRRRRRHGEHAGYRRRNRG